MNTQPHHVAAPASPPASVNAPRGSEIEYAADAAPASVAARPVPAWLQWLRRGWDATKSAVMVALVGSISLLLLWVTYARAVSVQPHGRTAPAMAIVAGSAPLVCALPLILTACVGLLVSRSRNARLTYDLSTRAAAEHAPAPEMRAACEDAARFWRHERAQGEHTSSRMIQQALFYGFFSTLLLCAAGVVLVAPLLTLTIEAKGAPYRVPVAVAIVAAVLTMFARDIGRMLVRAASRDASAQMLAWSSKRLLVVVTVTTLACCILIAGDLNAQLLPRAAHWVLLGAGIAFLGDRATESVTERVAQLVGVPAKVKLDGDSLNQIDGLAEEDCARLAEEGIDGAHALALYSTPKLFFNTPYTLHRICDWQDQALLIARLGQARARVFREQLMVRGAIDAQRLALDLAGDNMPEGERSDVMKILGFSTGPQMRIAMSRLARDEVAARLVVYRAAMPVPDVTATERGTR